MSRSRKALALLALSIAGGLLLWWQQPPAAEALNTIESAASTVHTVGQAGKQTVQAKADIVAEESQQSAKDRAAEQFKQQASEFRTLLAKRPGNLQQWLDQLWLQCRDMTQHACQTQLAGLSLQLTTAEMAQLQALLANYHRYQNELSELQLSTNLSVKERVSAIQQLRDSIFGALTDTLFGQEQQFASYQIAVDDLNANMQALTVSERLAKLAQLQQQLASADTALFGPEQAYQQALLLLKDLSKDEQQHWQQQLRQQYFGEGAKAVAAFEQQQQQLAEQRADYQSELAVLEQEYARRQTELSSDQWQQQYAKALAELRLRHFPTH